MRLQMDQLFRIASTMGSFTAADWPEGARLASMRSFHLPEMMRVGMTSHLRASPCHMSR
jgi:hypothetical protein